MDGYGRGSRIDAGSRKTRLSDCRHDLQENAVSLRCPTSRQIAENSAVDAGVVVQKMLESEGNVGFDAARNEYVDLVAAVIIDPKKVVRIALENAVSVASLLLLTEATMTEIEEPESKAGSPQAEGL